ncbi:type I-E CRISPR-associated protein Cse1/CasA [Natronosporangium hydrolyticum]|uniref:Type I-E CRISPR-associated protein Cse1/CasA n=1 Tax=Natronosporangium hydrolyticum TaxID=2811111 RepID=A0A895YAJ9_9ACTN|nr:type I-E CRISPR-associated protein Cse1/CasA [Natronosporangium hydrolyticum]QSB14411.1 type I-E CRISPR-associated protein Cse1/CasA [Natronosporangium hydrolyticum]
MTGAAYDLTEQPWLLVHRLDGRVEEVSIREVFARASEFRALLGDLPTQSFALVRLLLAILHQAVDGPQDLAGWRRLWQDPALPMADVNGYLDHFRGRFDLLSAETPFYQVADLHTAKEQTFTLERLIADVPAGSPYFTTRLKSGVERISYPEAARWLVHCQAFDPSGIKSGAVGDARVKGGKGYPIGTGWAGALGGVLVEGRDLRETLLLQLVPRSSQKLDLSDLDVPVWERPPHTAAEEIGGARPYGPLDLYTWQSRRLRLWCDGASVTGAMIANGDRIAPQNMHRREPMSAWRRSKPQERKLGTVPVYMPREHEVDRALWRQLGALLPNLASSRDEPPQLLPPAVLEWLAEARGAGAVEGHYRLRTRAIGMTYGTQQATTDDVIDDAVALSIGLLAEANRELGSAAVDAVTDAEVAVQALGHLAGNLALAAGGASEGPQERARETGYAELDRPFRSWLAGLAPDTDIPVARAEWQRTTHQIVIRLGSELVTQAGPAAWRGRTVNDWHVSTPEADLRFRKRLRDSLPWAYPKQEEVMA